MDDARTWIEVSGGSTLTIAIRHSGPPVTARVSVQFREISQGPPLPEHAYDLDFRTKSDDAPARVASLSPEIDIVRATIARVAAIDFHTSVLTISLPGAGVINRPFDGSLRLSFELTLVTATPAGDARSDERYTAVIENQHIQVSRGSEVFSTDLG